MTEEPIHSPCIKVCAIDGTTGWCLGCGRSLEEIARWVAMGEDARQATQRKLANRLQELNDRDGWGETR